ncbi:MAG: hypothetical protein ACJ71U_15860 [Terriglobales bacterium]|jgi:hypothetical protein
MITIESATFEMLEEPPLPEWVMRVTVKGSGFERRALPLFGKVGSLAVQGIQIDPDETGFIGYLVTEPAEGDVLHVGYPEGDLLDTGIAYHRLVA